MLSKLYDILLLISKLKCQLALFMDKEITLERKLKEKEKIIENLNKKFFDIELCSSLKMK
jgi:hypothetical protein